MPMVKFSVISFCLVFVTVLGSGCQKKGVFRSGNEQPFVPVGVTMSGLYEDASVEKEIEKRLFCRDCLFIHAGEDKTSYSLTVYYDRRMDLKSLGYMVLSLNLAAFEAQFFYTLQVKVQEGDRVLKEYIFREQTVEETSSTLGDTFNPFHDENGRSEEIFAALTDKFLLEIQTDNPLPRITEARQ